MMYLDIFLKLVIGLVALLSVIRLLGKKELAQLTPFDFVYTLILGGILEESLFDEKIKITHFLFAIALWAILIYIIERATKRWNPIRVLLKGEPVNLISNGQLNMKAFDKHHLEMEQLRSALRKQGVFTLREVRDLFLEPSGDITINKFVEFNPITNEQLVKKPDNDEPSILVIDEGEIQDGALTSIGKSREWLMTELTKENYPIPQRIAYGEWSKTAGLYIRTY